MSEELFFYVKAFQYYAFADYVIRGHVDYKDWVYNNYIQVCAKDVHGQDLEVDYLVGSVFGKHPLMNMIDHYEIKKHDGKDAYDLILNGLEQKRMYYIFLDHYYIKSSSYYGKKHWIHDVFVVRRENGVIYYLENTDGFIHLLSMPESELATSYIEQDNHCTFELSVNNDFRYKFSIDRFCLMLKDYVMATDSLAHQEEYLAQTGYYSKEFFEGKLEHINYWGINVYDSIAKNTIECAQNGKFVDYRWFYLMKEKNDILCDKLLYCESKGYIGMDDVKKVNQQLMGLSNDIKKGMNRVVKYVYSGFNLSGIPEVGENLLEIKKKELEVYASLLRAFNILV